jgi:hypothetical protein
MKIARAVAVSIVLHAPCAVARDAVVERVVAVVDGAPILLSEVRQRAAPQLRDERDAAVVRRVFQDTLALLVDERMIAKHALARGIVVTPSEVDAQLARVAYERGVDVAALFDLMQLDRHLDADAYRAEVERQLLERRVLSAKPSAGADSHDSASPAAMSARRHALLRTLRQTYGARALVSFK